MSHAKKFWVFTALVLVLSFLLWGLLALFRFRVPNLAEASTEVSVLPMALYVLNGFMPSVLGLCMYRVTEKKTWKKELKTLLPKSTHLKVYGEIMIVFAIMIFSQVLLYHFLIEAFDFSAFYVLLPQLIPLVILGPLSEEIGWRGYLEKQADGFMNPLLKPLVIGVVWALWHLPLFYLLGTTQQVNDVNFLTFSFLVILLSIIMSHYRQRTDRSLFTGVLTHYLYTVGLTFYIFGTTYSLTSDLVSILPFFLFALIVSLRHHTRANPQTART